MRTDCINIIFGSEKLNGELRHACINWIMGISESKIYLCLIYINIILALTFLLSVVNDFGLTFPQDRMVEWSF